MRFRQIMRALLDFQTAVPAMDFKVETDPVTGLTQAVVRVDLSEEEEDLFVSAMSMMRNTF